MKKNKKIVSFLDDDKNLFLDITLDSGEDCFWLSAQHRKGINKIGL